jgi:hypothetical protein
MVEDPKLKESMAHKDARGLSFPIGQNIKSYATSIEIDHVHPRGAPRHSFSCSITARLPASVWASK